MITGNSVENWWRRVIRTSLELTKQQYEQLPDCWNDLCTNFMDLQGKPIPMPVCLALNWDCKACPMTSVCECHNVTDAVHVGDYEELKDICERVAVGIDRILESEPYAMDFTSPTAVCSIGDNCTRDDEALDLLQSIVSDWPEFDGDESVNGGDMVEWFGEFRQRVKKYLNPGEKKDG